MAYYWALGAGWKNRIAFWISVQEQDWIAIMAAQRSLARIDAVELDFGAASEAAFNVSLSPWKDRITVYCMDFCRFYDKTTKPVYHHILSNPPYFIDSLLPPDGKRERARHTGTLDYEVLFEGASYLLLPDGKLSLVSPADLQEHLIFYCFVVWILSGAVYLCFGYFG